LQGDINKITGETGGTNNILKLVEKVIKDLQKYVQKYFKTCNYYRKYALEQ
jgi:hypothetical protein